MTARADDRPAESARDAHLGAVGRAVDALRVDARLAGACVTRPHPLIGMVRREDRAVLVVPSALWDRGRDLLRPYAPRLADGRAAIVLMGRPRDASLDVALNRGLAALLPDAPDADELYVAVHNALELLDARGRAESRARWVDRYRYELGELIEIARAITKETDIDRLLDLILVKSRFVTGADAGSIYVVEGDDPDVARRSLRFKLSQNESVRFDQREFTLPVSPRSMAGAAALYRKAISIVDVYDMPADSPFGFERSFDDKLGYRTRSVLCMPLVGRRSEVIGVIQLINKKRDPAKRLQGPVDVAELVVPFDERSEELLATLAAQAGIALENALLLEEIRRIFEGFVGAAVEAIEQRDPTTSGHSRRVADLTVTLAEAVARTDTGPYRELAFSEGDLRELRYASLLHDFGKIGVREQVLVKAKKLHDWQLAAVRARMDLVARSEEAEGLRRRIRAVEAGACVADLRAIDAELGARRAEIEEAWATVVEANEPSVLRGGSFGRIEDLGRREWLDREGVPRPLLEPDEIVSLCIPRGSLTPVEMEEIRSHVVHTYEFLSKIPWGRSFRRVPQIAGAHHERLNGTGYPNRLLGEEIPVQSKMMSVSDIFDALTAADRPYKRAVPLARALEILDMEVRDGHLDGELVRIFRAARAWECVLGAGGVLSSRS